MGRVCVLPCPGAPRRRIGLCLCASVSPLQKSPSKYLPRRTVNEREIKGHESGHGAGCLRFPVESCLWACGDSLQWHSGHTQHCWQPLSRYAHSSARCMSVMVLLRVITLWGLEIQHQADSA